MANFGDFKGSLDKIISLLKRLVDKGCPCEATTTAGADISVPEGLKSVALVKTSPNSDSVIITLSDASTYIMTEQGEVFIQSATGEGRLPAYVISGAGSYKWHGIK